jgi:hypothetical protein
MATPSPRPAPADWKGAAAVLAAAEALPDAEADDEAEADEADADADAAEAEDWEAVADAEDEADEPDEGQLGLVLSSTLEPLHRAVARVMVPASKPAISKATPSGRISTHSQCRPGCSCSGHSRRSWKCFHSCRCR